MEKVGFEVVLLLVIKVWLLARSVALKLGIVVAFAVEAKRLPAEAEPSRFNSFSRLEWQRPLGSARLPSRSTGGLSASVILKICTIYHRVSIVWYRVSRALTTHQRPWEQKGSQKKKKKYSKKQ